MSYDAVIAAPFGRVGIRTDRDRLVDVDFVVSSLPLKTPQHAYARRVCRALRRYFADSRHRFRLPLALKGSTHQQRVWRLLTRIPAGKVRTYGDIAREIGSSPRAVGAACRTNPIAIIVPCHRVVAHNEIGGFMGRRSGSALAIKRWLLAHEQRP
jgi:methylated-DNA-[protein]-cysteine S-methyltransferase